MQSNYITTKNVLPHAYFKICHIKNVRANCFCPSLLRTQIHIPRHASSARAKYWNDRTDGHCYSFAWIKRSWMFSDPYFSFQKQILFTIIHIVQKWTKNQCGKVKKIHDLCLWDIKSCHLAAARRTKLWLLNTNLLFEEHHQLTKFTRKVHLKHIWQRKFPFKALIAISPIFTSRASSLQNKVREPPFFPTFLTSPTHHLLMVKFSEKNQC